MNGEMDNRAAPAAAVVAGLAAAAVGVVFARWGLATTPTLLVVDFYTVDVHPVGVLTPAITALAAALAVLAGATLPALSRLSGWAVAAAGALPTLVALQLTATGRFGTAPTVMPPLLAAGVGVMLGGVLLAAGGAAPRARLATAAGLAAGLVLAGPVTALATPRYDPDALVYPHLYLPAAALGLCIAAAVLAMSRPAPAPTQGTGVGTGAWAPAVAVLAAALVLHAGRLALTAAVDGLRVSRDGLASPRRVEFVEDLARYGTVAVGVAVALVLTGYAYRRGRADLARWTVLCFALAAPLLIGVRTTTAVASTLAPLVAGLVAAALGVLAATRADRLLPWDVLGLWLTACGVAVTTVAYRQGPPWLEVGAMVTAAGLGFALSAGLVRVLRTAEGEPGRVAGSVLLGFATLLLAGQALGALAVESAMSAGYGDVPLTVPVLVVVTSVVLLLLFGLGRAVDRIRRDIRDEARRAVS